MCVSADVLKETGSVCVCVFVCVYVRVFVCMFVCVPMLVGGDKKVAG